MMKEFNHDIPGYALTQIKTAGDAVDYFLKPVFVQSPLESMTKVRVVKESQVGLAPVIMTGPYWHHMS